MIRHIFDDRSHPFVLLVVLSLVGMGAVAPVMGAEAEMESVSAPLEQQGTTSTVANSSNASVTLANQTTNGSTVQIESATLPDGGFVVLTNDPYSQIGLLQGSIIAVSEPLPSGTHNNISLRVQNSPPGGYINTSMLNTTGGYAVGVHRDTNHNDRFDFITSVGSEDGAYISGAGVERSFTSSAATLTIPETETETETASIRIEKQSAGESSITVRSVTLPDGGFVAVHENAYLQGGDPTQTVLGSSSYLSPGSHQDVPISLSNLSGPDNQTLVVVASRDSNSNKSYDYVRSDGFHDVPYRADGDAVLDSASVSIPANVGETATATASASSETNRSSNKNGSVSIRNTSTTTAGSGDTSGSEPGWFRLDRILLPLVIVVIVGYLIYRRL